MCRDSLGSRLVLGTGDGKLATEECVEVLRSRSTRDLDRVRSVFAMCVHLRGWPCTVVCTFVLVFVFACSLHLGCWMLELLVLAVLTLWFVLESQRRDLGVVDMMGKLARCMMVTWSN